MSGREDRKRKLRNSKVKNSTMKGGFFNPAPRTPVTTLENFLEELPHIWMSGELGFIEYMPLEILVCIFSRHDKVADLCLVNKFFLRMTRSGPFREFFLYLNCRPYAVDFKCYRIVIPSLFNNLELSDVVVDPILWKRLLKSKRTVVGSRDLFVTGREVYINEYTCSLNNTGVVLYEGELTYDISELNYLIPHGLGVCYNDNIFSMSGTWDSGVLRSGNICIGGKVFITIEKSSVPSHRDHLIQGVVCRGSIQFDVMTGILNRVTSINKKPSKFEGIWMYPLACSIESHVCNYLAMARFVEGVLTFEDEIHTGTFIDAELDIGTIKTISTGAIKVVGGPGPHGITISQIRRNVAHERARIFQENVREFVNLFGMH